MSEYGDAVMLVFVASFYAISCGVAKQRGINYGYALALDHFIQEQRRNERGSFIARNETPIAIALRLMSESK